MLVHQRSPAMLVHQQTWVACDECGKWRCISATARPRDDERWTCAMNKANPQQSTCDSPEEEWGLPITAQPQLPPPQPSSLNGRGGGGGGGGGSRKKRKTSTSNGPRSSNKSTSPSSSSTSSSPPSTSSASKKRRRTDCAAIWRAEAASPLRTGRNPARGVEPSKNTQKLVELILASDSSVEVLRLSERMDKESRSCDILAVLDALLLNDNCQALYIHNQPGLVADPNGRGMATLVEVLKRGRIWALNIGETFLSTGAWECFADAVEDTQVTHMFAELDMFPELKTRFRDAIRANRAKHDRHRALDNRDVVQRINNMWWNPRQGQAFKAALQRRREALSWEAVPGSRLTAAQIAEAHDLSEELDAQWAEEWRKQQQQQQQQGGVGVGVEEEEGQGRRSEEEAARRAQELLRINALRRKCMLLLQAEGGNTQEEGGGGGGGGGGGAEPEPATAQPSKERGGRGGEGEEGPLREQAAVAVPVEAAH